MSSYKYGRKGDIVLLSEGALCDETKLLTDAELSTGNFSYFWQQYICPYHTALFRPIWNHPAGENSQNIFYIFPLTKGSFWGSWRSSGSLTAVKYLVWFVFSSQQNTIQEKAKNITI